MLLLLIYLRRIGFRVLLPAVNTLLFSVLVSAGSGEAVHSVAIGLNAPAFLVAAALGDALAPNLSEAASAQRLFFMMAPLLAGLWFLTGRWLDRRLGWLPPRVRNESRVVLFPTMALVGAMQLWLFYRIVHGETAMAAAWETGLACWFTLWQVMLVTALRRRPVPIHSGAQPPDQHATRGARE